MIVAIPVLLLVPVAVLALAAGLGQGLQGPGPADAAPVPSAPSEPSAPSAAALAEIPAPMLALYRAAAPTCPGLSWSVLAAIGKVESDHGRVVAVSSAGAEGPMQFLPSTWAAYAVDGNADGTADIWEPADAVFTAAHYLCANGAGTPAGLPGAIWHYNHDVGYVLLVLGLAAHYAAAAAAAAPVAA